MDLHHEFTYTAMIKPPVEVGAGPLGTRMYFEAIDGPVTGERLSGRVLTGGGDWALLGPDGFVRLDVRAQLRTDDGAAVYLRYEGLLEFNEAVQRAMATGSATDWGDHYFRTTPILECGDPRYQWVTQTVFVGEGRIVEGLGVQYRVHAVR